ncbi:MAG: GIY-YIG nuclease family protein [Saprospiraceae bacterium]
MHYVYIIYSPSHDLYYKGYTTDFKQRLAAHNNKESRYTAEKGHWELKYLEAFDLKSDALKREKMLKRQNRSYLTWLFLQPSNILDSVG